MADGTHAPVKELTYRETQVLRLAMHGFSGVETAEILGLSHSTVKTYKGHILRKLGAKNMVQAAVLYLDKGGR